MQRRSAFTLIELLVTLAIIGLLVTMLLSSMGGTRDLARRTQCQNLLRQLYQSHTMYLLQENNLPAMNKEQDEGAWQYNYLIRDSESWDYNFGPILKQEFIDVPELLYCPVQDHPYFAMGTPENPWIHQVLPVEPMAAPVMTRGDRSRAGFARRYGLSGKSFTVMNSGMCLAADVLHLPQVVRSSHLDGLNAVYGDGHADWVRDPGLFTDNELGTPFDRADNVIMQSIWETLEHGG